jgi:pimeloyl-ACP methyl ester carboxylesterase
MQEGPVKQTIRSVLLLLLILAVPATLIALFLLFDAETWNGRLFATSCLGLYSGSCALYLRLKKGRRAAGRAALALSGVALIGFAACYAFSPPGVTSADSKLHSVCPPDRHYARWTPVGLVPEMDQIKLGADLTPYADSLMTRAKAERMKGLFLVAYREMQQDPEFVAVGSVMGHAYTDAFGLPFNDRHLFAYVPAHKPGQKLPVLLFLHGSCGNFKAYLWTWKRFADDHQIAIVAPTFGFGNWHNPGGMAAIDWAYDYCAKHSELDAGRIVLAGLSNGGLGVSRAVCRNSGRFRGLIYISAVLEGDVLASPAFMQACKGKLVLVIHGDQDERIPVGYVKQHWAGLTGTAAVKTSYYADEDHFLFLARRAEVFNDVFSWMAPLVKCD